jgi:hypothetical protein
VGERGGVLESLTERQRRGKKMLQLCVWALKGPAGKIEATLRSLAGVFTFQPNFDSCGRIDALLAPTYESSVIWRSPLAHPTSVFSLDSCPSFH